MKLWLSIGIGGLALLVLAAQAGPGLTLTQPQYADLRVGQVGSLWDVTFTVPNQVETDMDPATYGEAMERDWETLIDDVLASGQPARVTRCEKISPRIASCDAIFILNVLVSSPDTVAQR